MILLGPMEQAGLALAATIGVYANSLMLLSRMRRHFPTVPMRALAERQVRVWGAAIGAAAVAVLLNLVVPTDDMGSLEMLPALIGKLAVATVVYVVLASRLARPELADAAGQVRALVGRRPANG